MTPQEVATRWKWLKSQVAKIQDPVFRDCVMAEYQKRAVAEWGYCPDKTEYKDKEEEVILSPEEQKFLQKIEMAQRFGVWKKDENVEKEARTRMCQYIEQGGKYEDLPEDIKCPSMHKFYIECLIKNIDDTIIMLDSLK